MSFAHRDRPFRLAALVSVCLAVYLCGCGTPGAPQPPSLNLPDRVDDLSATRVGNQVSLTWTMPKRNTDRLALKGNIAVRVCRQHAAQASSSSCETAADMQLAPASDGAFSETLPAALTSGSPRNLTYFVELKNRKGRSAGLSNPAVVLAGEAPAPVTGLAAEVRKDGIVLRWNSADPGTSVRLRRTLLTPAPPGQRTGPLPSTPEPIEKNLLVESRPGSTVTQAIDKDIVLGNTYEYRAQRILREPVAGNSGEGNQGKGNAIELDGSLSAPIRVDALNVFPPPVPAGMVAVATGADPASGTPASIDLSWQPNTEPDLAGYEVYRREDQTPWQRISGDLPVFGPAFHDAHVLPGHTYRYGVSAVDKQGHESGRSAEAEETVPNP
jgi:hypothetical protein